MQKLRAQISYCDPATRRIEGLIKGGAIVQIVVWEIPATFRWPQEREVWTIHYSNGYWHLGQKIDYETEPDVTTQVEGLSPGDTRVATGGKIILDGDVQVYGTLSASNLSGDVGGSSASFAYSSSPPPAPSIGDLWMDSDTGKLFIFVSDGNSALWLEP
jgi:hypothetical protein